MRQHYQPVKVLRVRPRFELGTVLVSGGVSTALSKGEIDRLLYRHTRGDWGAGYIGQGSPNERFLLLGFRLDSHYRIAGCEVLITTDLVCPKTNGRPSTTVYLFEEYAQVHQLA
ncbi:MAG: hypothetical protein ACRCZF_26670 [Gemmataceae bacterium]